MCKKHVWQIRICANNMIRNWQINKIVRKIMISDISFDINVILKSYDINVISMISIISLKFEIELN